jgi:hypothetical protein
MRRSDRCIRLQDQSVVAGDGSKTQPAVATAEPARRDGCRRA